MQDAVSRNVAGYTKRAARYDELHPEIFNTVEQDRLRTYLERAVALIESGGSRALDFGCGSGNLTRHLLALGLDVTAADVTPAFLRLVEEQFGVPTVELVDGRIDRLDDGAFDLIAMYSVAHHIPDYLGVISGLVAKLKPGGVLVVEHESHRDHYFPTPELAAFRAANHEATRGGAWDPEHKRWQHLLRAAVTPSRHLDRYRRIRGIPIEGDIHVFPHDHIEWDRLTAALAAAGADVVDRSEHLAFVAGQDRATWEHWRERCVDQASMSFRRRSGPR